MWQEFRQQQRLNLFGRTLFAERQSGRSPLFAICYLRFAIPTPPSPRPKHSIYQPRAARIRNGRPHPLEKDGNPVAESDEKNQMDKARGEQGKNPAKADHFQVCDRSVPANRSHLPLVIVSETSHGTTLTSCEDVFGGMTSHLHRNRTNSW